METGPKFLRPLTAPDAEIGQAVHFGPEQALLLDCGRTLAPCTLAYMTYGALNAARSNAVLVCHALTGDQFVASAHPVTGKPGWWEPMVGPGKPIDTDRFFVICANVIGGCMGSTGPAEIDPATGKPYGLSFPLVTIRDMVRAQAMLLDALGIEQAALRHRRIDGRHAGAAMGGELSRARGLGDADRLRRQAFGAEHRLPRSRPPGDHGRSRLEGRRLSASRHAAVQGAGGGAHGRAHHLSFGSGAAAQIRPQPAEPRRASPSPSRPTSRSNPICTIRA